MANDILDLSGIEQEVAAIMRGPAKRIGRKAKTFNPVDMAPAIIKNPSSPTEMLKAIAQKEKAGYTLRADEAVTTMSYSPTDYQVGELFEESEQTDSDGVFSGPSFNGEW